MFLVTSNQHKQLLCSSYIGRVTPAELAVGIEDTRRLLADLPPGFRSLVDFARVESIELDCVEPIGRLMDLLDKSGVGLIVRVIPDPAKDIGMNILSVFHYPHRPNFLTVETMAEAGRHLGL